MITTKTNVSEVKKMVKKKAPIAQVPQRGKAREGLVRFAHKPFFVTLDFSSDSVWNDNLVEAARGFCELGFLINVLNGEKNLGEFEAMAQDFPGQVHMTTSKDMDHLLKHSDAVIFLDVGNTKALQKYMEAGVVPITLSDFDLTEFDAEKEKGNSFLIHSGSKWEIFASGVRAYEAFRFSYDWKELQKRAKKVYLG